MSQHPITDYPIDPTTTSGTDLAERLNRTNASNASNHSGATRPPYLTAGGMWTKAVAADAMALMWFDGTTDHEICKTVGGVFSVTSTGGAFLPLTGGTLSGKLTVQGDIDATGDITAFKP